MKVDAIERFTSSKTLYAKAHNALVKKGSQDKTYPAAAADFEELLYIRFTSRTIERLCDSVRGMVESVRGCERKIQQICVDKVRMPRPTSSRSSLGNEMNLDWVDAEIASSQRTYAQTLIRNARRSGTAQKLIDLQNHIGIPLKEPRTSTSRCPPVKPRPAAPSAR